GLTARRNAGFPDAALENTPETRLHVARFIRSFRPRVVIIPFMNGRHPDHRVASQLAYDACFLAGLGKLPVPEPVHRPTKILYTLTYREEAIKPTFVVDIRDHIETTLAAIRRYSSLLAGTELPGEACPTADWTRS